MLPKLHKSSDCLIQSVWSNGSRNSRPISMKLWLNSGNLLSELVYALTPGKNT